MGAAKNKALAGVMGSASAAALLLVTLTGYEGKRNVGYRDIVGIPTACMGDTKNVVVGKFYSDAECQARLSAQALVHVAEVQRCTPTIAGNQLVAAGSLAYNIGGSAYCRSTVARRFNARDLRGGCNAFLAWNRAGGRVIAGLARRREGERALCLKGVA
ncbi:lysozyme [Sphingomonas sp.]|jgi:lysozyme|uniref:lysozyme n=1 Tax=Sphingomonas sp. TaxID=28214 RepID=UPI002ED93C2E